MAQTTAQRQAAYRARRAQAGDNGERRLSTYLSMAAALALGRLAKRDGVTKRQMIERLLIEKDKQVIDANKRCQ